ncbi:hypothetical protein Tco_0588102 [Tanacetum coccineum]
MKLRASECPYHFLKILMRLLVRLILMGRTLSPSLSRTPLRLRHLRSARMAVRVPHTMSPGLSTSMTEVAAMSDSTFHKRFRSSYESLPSSSPPDLPSRKRYRGTSEVSEDAEDRGPTAEDEDPAARDKGLVAGDKVPGIGVESRGSDDESHDLDDEGHIVEAAVSAPLGLGYGALRRWELALEEDQVYSTFEVGQGFRSTPESERPERVSASRQPTLTTWIDQEDGMVYIDVPSYPPPAPPVQTPPSPEWSSFSLPISSAPFFVPSPISSPMIPLTIPSPIATPDTAETKGFLTKLGAQVEIQGGLIRDHTRPVLALESWAGQTEAQRAALWHAINDRQGENHELRSQLAEERRAQLELAEIVDSMRRGQEPKGDS